MSSSIMESFLRESKISLAQLSSYETVCIVLGNETCDLDSTVCALVQGLLEYTDARKRKQNNIAVIPVMNITEKQFRIKTEVVYTLKSHNITCDLLTFRDQICLSDLLCDTNKKLELILVDHHTLSDEDFQLKPSVVAIIDHRPLNLNWSWLGVSLNIQTVGSCATLVARNVLQRNPELLDAQVSSLLRNCILIDTYNMSDDTGQKTSSDVDILNIIEQLGGLTSDRTEVFNKIINAKTDISELTLDDLMIKDLKVISGIPLVGFPILVKDFLKKDNVNETIEKFGKERKCDIVILIGLDLSNEHVCRDIAIVCYLTQCNQLEYHIISALTSSTNPNLDLEETKEIITGCKFTLHLYRQKNVKITRKQILPLVQKAVCCFDAEQSK